MPPGCSPTGPCRRRGCCARCRVTWLEPGRSTPAPPYVIFKGHDDHSGAGGRPGRARRRASRAHRGRNRIRPSVKRRAEAGAAARRTHRRRAPFSGFSVPRVLGKRPPGARRSRRLRRGFRRPGRRLRGLATEGDRAAAEFVHARRPGAGSGRQPLLRHDHTGVEPAQQFVRAGRDRRGLALRRSAASRGSTAPARRPSSRTTSPRPRRTPGSSPGGCGPKDTRWSPSSSTSRCPTSAPRPI